MKHENVDNCLRCADMLKDGHPDIQYWFYMIKEAFPTVHTSCVYRGKEAQDLQVKEGRSLLKWPNSKHNTLGPDKSPCSQAMDLFRLDDSGKADFRMGFYVQIANFLEDAGAPIDWGGVFKHFVDAPHFQLRTTAKG